MMFLLSSDSALRTAYSRTHCPKDAMMESRCWPYASHVFGGYWKCWQWTLSWKGSYSYNDRRCLIPWNTYTVIISNCYKVWIVRNHVFLQTVSKTVVAVLTNVDWPVIYLETRGLNPTPHSPNRFSTFLGQICSLLFLPQHCNLPFSSYPFPNPFNRLPSYLSRTLVAAVL